MSVMKIIVKQAGNGQWYVLITAGNHKVIFQSSEYYKDKRSAYKAIEALRKHPLKNIEEQ